MLAIWLLLLTADHRGGPGLPKEVLLSSCMREREREVGLGGEGERERGTVRRESSYTIHSNGGHWDSSGFHKFTFLNNPVMNIFVPKSLPAFLLLCLG